jgi:hypothetical protein
MNQKVVHIKASVDFYGLTPADLVLQAKTIHDAMPNNPLYTGAPVDPATLEGAIDSYIASAAQATDSKKAVAEREKQRTALIRLLRQLAHAVEILDLRYNRGTATLRLQRCGGSPEARSLRRYPGFARPLGN